MLFFLGVVFLFPPLLKAEPQFSRPIQITTNPGEDFAAEVSPDDRFMVYVSDQSGNLDLWLKHLGAGVQPPDERLTFHSAQDNSPTISPDGKWVAFVSNRSDARGDLYLLNLEKRNAADETAGLTRLTQGDFPESDPAWSPDQKFLYFVSRQEKTGKSGVFKIEIKTSVRSPVEGGAGINPAVSPDGRFLALVAEGGQRDIWVVDLESNSRTRFTSGPPIDAAPAWSRDGKRIFFVRYHDDTNFDGQVTIDDNPNIWSVEFRPSGPGISRQLTDSSTYDLFPVLTEGEKLFFTTNRNKGIDIWQLPADGLMPRASGYGLTLQLVEDLCSGDSRNAWPCLLAYNNLILEFGDQKWISRIRYRLGRAYQTLRHPETARQVYAQLVKNDPEEKRYKGLAEIEILLLETERAKKEGATAYRKKIGETLKRLDKLLAAYPEQVRVAARVFLEKGHLQLQLEEPAQALDFYKKVIQNFPSQRSIAAEAAFSQSQVYSMVGDQKGLVEAFVQVVRNYYDVESWTRKAIHEILALFENHPTLEKKVSSLQALAMQYKDLPLLAAAVQNRIGELYYRVNENLLAKEAYKKTVDRYPAAPSERFAALFTLAGIYSEEENFEKSLGIYRQISDQSADLEESLNASREGYIRKSLEKGNWELRVGEVKLALKTFLKLIDFSPETVEAHRGYIQAAAALGKTGKTIRFYEDRLKTREDSAVDHYALGLAHTYLDPPDLAEAEESIGRALAINSQQVYFHQTLGWVYEQKENLQKGEGYLERAVNEYQTALALNDSVTNAKNEADLLLNLGNGNYLLKNYFAAFHYYRERSRSGQVFVDPNREAIFHQRYGESAFKAGFPEEAVAQFKKALKIFSEKKDLTRMAELNDRIALAYQDHGDPARAVEYFSRTLELNRKTGNQVSLSRSLRNIANNLFALNQDKDEKDLQALNQALNNYFQSLDNLEKYGVASKKKKGPTGLIGIEIETSLGEDASGAATGFDEVGEQKLIFHYIGKIYGDFGEYGRAIDYFQKKLSLIPENLDPEKNIPVLLEKALIQNQIANYYFMSGDFDSSLRFFKASYDLSRQLSNRRGIAVNAANIGRVLLAKCRSLPLPSLKGEIADTIALLEGAARDVDEFKNFSNPEYSVVLHNNLGIFYHYLAFHLPEESGPGKAPAQPSNPRALVLAALGKLQGEYQYAGKSINHFEAALSRFRQSGLKREGMEAALRQNLELTYHLSRGKDEDRATEEVPAALVPFRNQWQQKYLQALEAPAEERLPLLMEAESLLTRLPYGMETGASISLLEDLYQALTRNLFDRGKIREALFYSEKGRQQLLISLRPRFQFQDADRRAYYEEVITMASRLDAATSGKEPGNVQEIREEYDEFLAMVRDDDPELASLLEPEAPAIEEVQNLLHPKEVLLKYQKVHDRILVWEVWADSLRGEAIPGDAALFHLIHRLSRKGEAVHASQLEILSKLFPESLRKSLQKADSLILIADGELEFLPWAAIPLGKQPLMKRMPVTFVSSLIQFRFAQSKKNLYNSRLLMVESPAFDKVRGFFASAVDLSGEEATLDRFQTQWSHYGVVNIDTPTHLGQFDANASHISLTRRTNQFQRIRLESLYQSPAELNFIALNDVDYRFDPELNLSPTAPLLHGLTFKGYSGVLLRTGKVDAGIHGEFLELFYKGFRRGHPAETLRQAQIALAHRHPDSYAWTGYRYYGFPGMDQEEKNRFAEEHFRSNAQKGVRAFVDKDWLAAIDYFEKALVLMSFLPDQGFAEKIYKTLAQAAYNQGDYLKGIHYQKELIPLAEKEEDPEKLAQAYFFLGILYSRAEEYPAAVQHLRKALSIYEEYEILDQLAESYSQLGIVEENALDYDKALEAFSASLRLHEEIGEDLNRGRELRRIGRIFYLRLNQYGEARKYFKQANMLFTELGETEQIVETLLELGLVAEKQGLFDQAIAHYRRAETLAQNNDLKLGLSKAFLYQGNSHWFQGDYQKAFRFQKQALNIAEAIGDKRQQAFIYNTLGLIYWTLNDSSRALTHLNHSLQLAEEIESVLDEASAYNNIGLVYRKDKKYEKSIEFFNKALERDIQLKTKWGQGYTHRNLGMSYLRMKRLDEAEPHIRQAVALSREIGNQTNLVKSMLELGNLAVERRQWKEALPLFRETASLSDKLNIPEVHWRALRGEGFCLVKMNRKAEAVPVYKKAVSVVDQMRAAIKVEEFQNGFLTDKQDVYKELVILLIDLGKVEESFNFAERAKSRSFIDLLGNQKISLKNDVSQKLYNALVAQKQLIRTTEEELGAARVKGDEEEMARLSEKLKTSRRRFQDLLIEAKEESPEISNFVTVETITLEKLQKLLAGQVALVEYLVTPRELVAWVVVPGRIDVVRTPVTEKELNAVIEDYRKRMQQLAPLEDQSIQLYNWLIKPVEPLIAPKRVLGIVPHGHLHYISFASLYNGESYLVERHPLFYSPSASVLDFTFSRKMEKGGAIKVLAIGNPDLGDFNYDLPLAEMEAGAIRWDFPKIDILTREKATESWLQKHIGDYQIIHIASHGEFDPINPLFSSLKLTKDETADGNFEVNEVFSLNIKADLVTLSACQTGLGDIVGGDELVGLNRAFIYAGTHAILSSLWRVSDISTAILIKHFYRNYVQDNKVESLRKAQLLVKKLYPHPAYWAGFSLSGDYR